MIIRKQRQNLTNMVAGGFDMNGPNSFSWDTSKLANMSEEKLYEFYCKLRSGDFILPAYKEEQTYEMKPISLQLIRRQYPKLCR